MRLASQLLRRSIPAWAGETFDAPPSENRPKVYPRVGGGNAVLYAPIVMLIGLSPRGRGKHIRWSRGNRSIGSIPAWAGETRRRRRCLCPCRVYPRVGGGNLRA